MPTQYSRDAFCFRILSTTVSNEIHLGSSGTTPVSNAYRRSPETDIPVRPEGEGAVLVPVGDGRLPVGADREVFNLRIRSIHARCGQQGSVTSGATESFP